MRLIQGDTPRDRMNVPKEVKDSHKNMSQWITDKVWETADGQEKKENKSK